MNNKSQVMSCGACAVVMNEDGETSTSIDMLVNGVKRFFASTRHAKSAPESVAAHI